MDYEDTKHARESVNRALAELKRHECVLRAYVAGQSPPCIVVEGIDGEAMSFKIDANGLVKARPILDWLGY